MNISYMYSLIAVIVLFLLAYVGVKLPGGEVFFGVIIPYLAIIIFVLGFINRVMDWARSPVPFRIPTTCGQQKSLPWIKPANIDNPSTTGGVIVRMILEVVFLRSLFRNTKCELKEGTKISYEWEKWLWLFSLIFHWSFFTVLFRHLRFFTEPVPACVTIAGKTGRISSDRSAGTHVVRRSTAGGRNLIIFKKNMDSPGKIHIPGFRLFPTFSYFRYCVYRYSDAVFYQSGHCRRSKRSPWDW